MAYYDNFLQRKKVTKLGKHVVHKTNMNIILGIVKYAQKCNMILEIGGGTGGFAYQANRKGWKYVGIEPNRKLAGMLKKYGKIYSHTVPPILLKGLSFDVIYSSNVIEHINQNEVFVFLEELTHRLDDKGLLIIMTPNYLDMQDYFWDCDYTHVTPFTKRRLEQLFSDVGLKIVNLDFRRAGFTGILKTLFFLINRFLRLILKLNIKNEFVYKMYLTTTEQITVFAQK